MKRINPGGVREAVWPIYTLETDEEMVSSVMNDLLWMLKKYLRSCLPVHCVQGIEAVSCLHSYCPTHKGRWSPRRGT